MSVMGIPVYFHYCGGELEKIDFITKGKSCCDDTESDAPEENKDCCKDESIVIQSAKDALCKKDERIVKHITLQLYAETQHPGTSSLHAIKTFRQTKKSEPHQLIHHRLISTFLLRI